MSDEQQQPTPPELDLDLSTIDTSFPVLRGGMYDLVCKKSEIGKSDKGGDLWILQLATTKPAKGVKGEDIKEGTVVFHRVSLQPTENYNREAIAKNAARFVQACRPAVTGIKGSQLFNGEMPTLCKLFEGRVLQVKIEALPEGFDKKSNRQLPARNEISQFVKA